MVYYSYPVKISFSLKKPLNPNIRKTKMLYSLQPSIREDYLLLLD